MRIEDIPNMVFIVGAPRCGTTTLATWMKQQPEICYPLVKEPHFFAQYDLRAMSEEEARSLTEREFVNRFFSQCEGEGKLAGLDGSVSYLYIAEQVAPALRFWPNAKFIIALRDPMDLLPSLQQRLRVTGDEDIVDFVEAWDAIPDRAAGRRIPKSCLEARWLRYDNAGLLGTYTKQMFDAVGRERCFVSVFDDLAADPEKHYRRLVEFLGFQPVDGIQLQARREGQSFRYAWLQRLLKRPPKFARNYLAGKNFVLREKKKNRKDNLLLDALFDAREWLLRWNKVPAVKQPIPVRVQQEIKDLLRDDIDDLGKLIGRDLSHWLKVREDRVG